MDKEKVLQLAKEAEILRQLSMEVPFVVDRLERFATLIEREVRGDSKACPNCGSEEVRQVYEYEGSERVASADECNACGHQWNVG